MLDFANLSGHPPLKGTPPGGLEGARPPRLGLFLSSKEFWPCDTRQRNGEKPRRFYKKNTEKSRPKPKAMTELQQPERAEKKPAPAKKRASKKATKRAAKKAMTKKSKPMTITDLAAALSITRKTIHHLRNTADAPASTDFDEWKAFLEARAADLPVACGVTFKLLPPPLTTGFGYPEIFAVFVSMPETPVNEDHCFVFWKDNIRSARKLFILRSVYRETQSQSVQHGTHKNLRLRILIADTGHVPGTVLRRDAVQLFSNFSN